jgi:hypothetical protein
MQLTQTRLVGLSFRVTAPRYSDFVIDLLLHEVVDLTVPAQLEAWDLQRRIW